MIITLVRGAGSRETREACWGSALNALMNPNGAWSDRHPCISTLINGLMMSFNDFCTANERAELIVGGGHFEAPLGTNTGLADEITRAFICADCAVRVFAPMALDAVGLKEDARKLRELAPIVDIPTAQAGAASAAWAESFRRDLLTAWLQMILDCCEVGRERVTKQIELEDLAAWQAGERKSLVCVE